MSTVTQKAEEARHKKSQWGLDLDLSLFDDSSTRWEEDPDFSRFQEEEKRQLLRTGVELTDADHAATFVQADASVIHCRSSLPGLEILPLVEAERRYPWVKDYLWRLVPVDSDKYTAQAELALDNGFFIRVLENTSVELPVETCLYLRTHGISQKIHNLILVEAGARLHVITGCTAHPRVTAGLHIGVSEFYVRAGGQLTSTMIHRWADDIHVRPRTTVLVEEEGRFISNYVLISPVGSVQTYPTVLLKGSNSVARLNSIVVAHPGSTIDIGGRVVLDAPRTRAEIISRAVTLGGISISRGQLIGRFPEIKAHLECRGLILSQGGIIQAIPELEGHAPNIEMTHEAAVGRLVPEEIEYLMARGLSEEEAVSMLVRGFLQVKIEGLPLELEKEIDQMVREMGKGL